MKTILRALGRTGLILIAALIVVAITVAVVPKGSSASGRLPRNAAAQQAGQAPQDGGPPPGGFEGGRDQGGFSLFGLFEVLQSLVIISVIAAVYVLAAGAVQRRKLSRPKL